MIGKVIHHLTGLNGLECDTGAYRVYIRFFPGMISVLDRVCQYEKPLLFLRRTGMIVLRRESPLPIGYGDLSAERLKSDRRISVPRGLDHFAGV